MSGLLEINKFEIDSKESFYELLKRRKNLQIINIHQSSKSTLYFFDKNEKEQFLMSVVIDGEIELYYNDKKEWLKSNDFFYYERLDGLVRVEIMEKANLFVVTSMDFFDDINEGFKIFFEMIDSIGQKDHYTKEHCTRVKKMSKKIGEKLNLSNYQLLNLTYAAQFHDIGKIKISDEILNKKGKFNEEEFNEMKRHVAYSREIFQNNFNFLKNDFDTDLMAEIIFQHHERLDGSGYPKGLKEGEISLEAKILAVCDSFDAMVTDRPYKKGKSKKEALNELKSLCVKLYDSKVVKCLEEVLNKGYDDLYQNVHTHYFSNE